MGRQSVACRITPRSLALAVALAVVRFEHAPESLLSARGLPESKRPRALNDFEAIREFEFERTLCVLPWPLPFAIESRIGADGPHFTMRLVFRQRVVPRFPRERGSALANVGLR